MTWGKNGKNPWQSMVKSMVKSVFWDGEKAREKYTWNTWNNREDPTLRFCEWCYLL